MGSPPGIMRERPPAFVVIGPAVTIDGVLVAEDLPPAIVAGPNGAFSLRSPCHTSLPVNNLYLAYEHSRPAAGQMTHEIPAVGRRFFSSPGGTGVIVIPRPCPSLPTSFWYRMGRDLPILTE